jgi:hypothetical protein
MHGLVNKQASNLDSVAARHIAKGHNHDQLACIVCEVVRGRICPFRLEERNADLLLAMLERNVEFLLTQHQR